MKLLSMWPTVLVGILAGLAGAPAGVWLVDRALTGWDEAHPVLRMAGTTVETDAQRVVLSIKGEKLRDCQYVRVVAYAVDSAGQRRDLHIRRVRGPAETGDNKAVGSYDIGQWELKPREDAKRVQVETQHLCGSRPVRTVIADVELPE